MLLFKDTKQGQSVYLFNRHTADYKVGTISVQPSAPHFAPNNPTLMTDIVIKTDEGEKTYAIPENLSVTFAGDWVIATEQHDLLREVENVDLESEKRIADVERLKGVREKCEKLKLELNPQLRERQETEERFGRIEKGMESLTSMFQEFLKKNNSII